MAFKLKLAVIGGEKSGEEFSFSEHDTFIFGRISDCHACLPNDAQVSRHHFIMEVNPPLARIRDLGSLNGTYVNDQKIGGRKKGETPEEGAKTIHPHVDLKDADKIKVGLTTLAVRIHAPAECGECGAEIPDSDRKRSEFGAGYLCGPCRAKGAGKVKPKAEPTSCVKCGKRFTGGLGHVPDENGLCGDCREKANNDPWQALAAMLAKARLKRNGEPVPSVEGYEILHQLGIGGCGAVYLARRKTDNLTVAVKVLLARVAAQDRSKKKFLQEMELLSSLRHPNIVSFFDQGSVGGAFYFVMEFCDAGSLADLMKRRGGKVPLDEAKNIMLQTLDGLAFAHAKGIVHRDLKPGNVLLVGGKTNRKVKVSDFGLAKNFEQAGLSGLTLTGNFGGTPYYMPREQIINFKRVKPVSDVWSIAATFYIMLTGWLPRDFPKGQDPLAVVLDGDVIPIRKRDGNIPKPLATVIDRALEKNPKSRFQDATELKEALTKALR
jgi:serine/threonine-protein kinase